MRHVGETVLFGDRAGPPFDRGCGDLHGRTTLAAHEVVVVPRTACPVPRLAVLSEQHVDLAGLRHERQAAIHGGEPDTFAGRLQQRVIC